MKIDKLIQELYQTHTDHEKLLKSYVCADGNCSDYEYGNIVGWKESMEFVIFKLEELKKREYEKAN